jgi:hypothetical protein
MKKLSIILTAVLLLVPSLVFSDVVTFRVGYFIPRAQSDLWEIEFENMNFTKSHFQNTNFSFSYEYFATSNISFLFGVEGYTKSKSGIYNDFVSEEIEGDYYAFDYGDGFPVSHVFSVSITPIQASIKFTPLGRKGKIIPYIAGGVGAYLWTVRLQGEMIDFEAGEEFIDLDLNAIVIGYPVFQVDAREENKLQFGFHAMGGIMVPIANRISIEGEVKYYQLTAPFKDGFVGFDPFDLSGLTISLGLNYWF